MARPVLSDDEVQAFRQRACDAAMNLFDEFGYDEFSMRALARELGCSHATPYRYFDGKEALFAAARAEGFRRFATFLQARLDGSSDARERLKLLAHGYFEFALAQPAAFRVIFELGQPTPGDYPESDAAAWDAWNVLVGTVEEAIRAGVVEGEALPLAHVLWAGIHGIAMLDLANKLVTGMQGPALVDAMTTALLVAHSPGEEP